MNQLKEIINFMPAINTCISHGRKLHKWKLSHSQDKHYSYICEKTVRVMHQHLTPHPEEAYQRVIQGHIDRYLETEDVTPPSSPNTKEDTSQTSRESRESSQPEPHYYDETSSTDDSDTEYSTDTASECHDEWVALLRMYDSDNENTDESSSDTHLSQGVGAIPPQIPVMITHYQQHPAEEKLAIQMTSV